MKVEKKLKKIILVIGILFVGLITLVIYQSYALFKTNKKMNFINTKVGEFGPNGDFNLAVFVDGEKTNEFPAKASGKLFEKIDCTNSGAARWDSDEWKLIVYNLEGPTSCNVYFAEVVNFKDILLAQNTIINGNPNLGAISRDRDTGMYKMADDYGESYYFRGTKDLLNNNVIFAEHQWKIIRINGDGSIRMIYNGTCPGNSCTINDIGTTTSIDVLSFNPANNNIKYVGYTYDTNVSSSIKTRNELWYTTNITSKNYDSYIADSVYCNDRSGQRIDGGITYYAATDRLVPLGSYSNVTPSLKCTNAADKYAKSATLGNGLLSQKIGLITADEVALAGGKFNTANTSYYLYTNQDYWTISPYSWHGSYSAVWGISSTGLLNIFNVYHTPYGVRPVISLVSNIQISGGNGSESTPYIISD